MGKNLKIISSSTFYLIILLVFSIGINFYVISPVFLFSQERVETALGSEIKMIRQGRVLSADVEKLKAQVPILIYHHIRDFPGSNNPNDETFYVDPENLEAQLEYLRENNFTSISFTDLANYLAGHFIMPAKPVIISFDDGLLNQYENALPVLKKYNFTATFFIFTNPIGRSKNYLTWEQVRELDSLGMEIGSHGKYHLFFDRLDGDDRLVEEVIGSKKIIEQNLGKSIFALAYPFGTYDQQVLELVKEAGYSAARDIINGATHTKEDLYNLRGYFVTNNFSRFMRIVN